jgi:hypothetical protein
MGTTFDAVRAEALFVSSVQSSQHADADEIRAAVAGTLRRLGSRECAALVAQAFGDTPETAVGRMVWALAVVRAVYGKSAKGAEAASSGRLALAG